MNHVRINRSSVLRDHIRHLNPQPGFQIRIGMNPETIRYALRDYHITTHSVHNGLGSPQMVRRSDGKMVPVTLVTFQ